MNAAGKETSTYSLASGAAAKVQDNVMTGLDRGEGNAGSSDGSAEALTDANLNQKLSLHGAQSGGNGTPHFRIARPTGNMADEPTP